MLINGQKINAPFRREIRFPRVEGDIVFTAQAVACSEEFDQLCPEIEPKVERDLNGNVTRVLHDDPVYIKKFRDRGVKKFDFQVLKCLVDVTWETVDFKDPESWKNWRNEAREIGLSDIEIMVMLNKIVECLNPTQEVVEEARKSFLAQKDQKVS